MTYFSHTKNHKQDCDCSFCRGLSPNETIAREQERCIEELTYSLLTNLDEKEFIKISMILNKLSILRRYFPDQKLPVNFEKLVQNI